MRVAYLFVVLKIELSATLVVGRERAPLSDRIRWCRRTEFIGTSDSSMIVGEEGEQLEASYDNVIFLV